MTDQTTTAPVVVAVGPEGVESALDFGVEEARRAGCGVHLVHAVQIVAASVETVVVPLMEMEKLGRETLSLAFERAENLVGDDVPLTHELRRGRPVTVLVEVGRDARMVVLEHRHRSRLHRALERTVAGGVAAHARVPVAAVPIGWKRTPETERVVVAAVDVADRSQEVLRTAATEARSRGATLRVVHAWDVPDPYEQLLQVGEEERWNTRAAVEVGDAVAALGELVDGLEVAVRIHHGRPLDGLLEASEGAELLVIGRHDPLIPIGSHIGPVARAVLREATCPVLLAAPHPRHRV